MGEVGDGQGFQVVDVMMILQLELGDEEAEEITA
jgi:hypothetical protein